MYVCFTVRILYRRDETEWINITFVSITRKRGARAGTKSWFECDNRIWEGTHRQFFDTWGRERWVPLSLGYDADLHVLLFLLLLLLLFLFLLSLPGLYH